MRQALGSVWGRLFRNWERVTADENGYPDVGNDEGTIKKTGIRALLQSVAILGTCVKEAPEFVRRRVAPDTRP
jgi:hypothetical protein